ncbi:MAG: hypothetical protein K5985_10925 [Lachnospiraceae bacterium]|nr:hypothetical protein [Lachnospiraceae bacterium]
MWVRQATREMMHTAYRNLSEYYEEESTDRDPETIRETEEYLAEQMEEANGVLFKNSLIQMLLVMVSLAIMFSIYTIISRREKQMELEKFRAEDSSRAKTVFLSNMSHEIRTPMNAIIGYTNLARREGITPEEMREYLDKIEGSNQHLLALINDVLEMSRIESGKIDLEPVPIDLKILMGEMRDLFRTQMEEKHIDYSVDTGEVKNSLVLCDKNRLNRVLLNLISNAYKFTPDGGRVLVSVKESASGKEGYGHYEISVADNGIGMSEEFATRVFEAFEREKSEAGKEIEGTGLGMAITKSIVDLMGGSVEVDTAPGKGTEFTVSLELELLSDAGEKEEAEADNEEKPSSASDFAGMRLLLAEDVAINREIAIMQLQSLGFAVEYAENGKEALDRLALSEPGYFTLY